MCLHVCVRKMSGFFFVCFLGRGTKRGNKLCTSLEVHVSLWMYCSYSDPSWETGTAPVLGWIIFSLTVFDAPPPSAEYHYIPSTWTLTARYVTYLIWSQFSGSELMGWFGNMIFSQGLGLNSWRNSAGFPCPRLQQCHSRVFIKA